MALTRSSPQQRAQQRTQPGPVSGTPGRRQEIILLLAASLVVILGLSLTFRAKTAGFGQIEAQLSNRQVLNLNTIESAGELVPYLTVFVEPNDRLFAARRIYERLSGTLESGESRVLPNIGSLASIRVSRRQIESTRGLQEFRRRLDEALKDPKRKDSPDLTVPLLTQEQLQQLKPSFAVRTPRDYKRLFWLYGLFFFAGFYVAHFVWTLFGFQGDRMLLPIAHLLTGIGFMLMLSLRDPLRDMTLFAGFVQGVALGCLLMLAVSFPDYQQSGLRRLSFVPLLASFLLSVTLILFGSGPGTSDAKVNLHLGPISLQPVEAIKFLLLLFLAGYFADRWEFLRELKEKSSSVPGVLRQFDLPRLRYSLPVFAGVLLALLFFFLQRDLGPALIISFLFLALYATARGRAGAAVLGSLVMIAGFAAAYWIGFPKTVAGRIGIWLSPWNNYVLPGGNHLAHSFWGFATGASMGTGSGLGEPGLIPAVHTDLVLSAIGEELGFIGLLAVFALYCLLIRRAFLISLNASGDYTLWLGLGLVLVTALQIVCISGGVLGLIPFSGVVTPFLSYGRSAIISNFILLGVLASISAKPGEKRQQSFERPVLWLTRILAGFLAAILIKLSFIQVIYPDDTAAAAALVVQSDRARRFEYNPRLIAVARMISRGTIYDRNDTPLASSKWEEVEQHRRQYESLGVDIDQPGFRIQRRYYPAGALTFHTLGDLRTKLNWAASNTSFVERDLNSRLQGYEDHARVIRATDRRTGRESYIIKRDYRELMPLLRYRYRPWNKKVQEILNRNRDIHLSLEIQFQRRVAQVLEHHIRKSRSQRGAAVVFDSHTGELLASVTYPWAEAPAQVIRPPMESEEAVQSEQEALIDRARYGVYTPGSSFKLITASAALRKDSNATNQTYTCIRLPDGRVGNFIQRSRRPIRDDILDREPHGAVKMERGLALSCNAYFAQLGTYLVGAEELARTAGLFGIKASPNNTAQEIRPLLPWASYGQGQVTVTPLQMARVAATIANDGRMPYTWMAQEEAGRTPQPQLILSPAQARMLGGFMREVVTNGTGRSLSGLSVPIAGKTGTAELENLPSHAWFVGYAPYGNAASRQVAFAVLVENGSYGGRVAAPAAGEIVTAAASLGLIGESRKADGRKQTAGGRRQEADGRKQEAGGKKQTAGSRRQTAGARRQEAGGGRQEAGGRKQEADGSCQSEPMTINDE